MKNLKQPARLLVFSLLSFAVGHVMASAMQLSQTRDLPPDVSHLAHVVEDAAHGVGYRSMHGAQIPDPWADGEKQKWLIDHTYITLFGKESDDSCLSIKGRIGVTILLFKDAETARQHLTLIKDGHLGNIGANVTKSDDWGYLLEEVNGSYAGIIAGAQVVLLEDRSRAQGPVIKTIAERVLTETR
jgi:hypothetical protein